MPNEREIENALELLKRQGYSGADIRDALAYIDRRNAQQAEWKEKRRNALKEQIAHLKKNVGEWVIPFDQVRKKKRVFCGVFVNGVRMRTHSGKHTWTGPGPAKAAFVNHMNQHLTYGHKFDEIVEMLKPEFIVEVKEVDA